MSSQAPSVCATVCAEIFGNLRSHAACRPRSAVPGLPARQAGAALVMGMILLVLLTLLGLTALGTSMMEERMAANARDRIRAFQAAEAALRLCESAVASNASTFDAKGGDGGMYDTALPERWEPSWAGWTAAAPTVRIYDDIPLVAMPPACIAERLATVIHEAPGASESLRRGLPVETERTYRHYRITARGVGTSERTVVMLQSHLRLRTE